MRRSAPNSLTSILAAALIFATVAWSCSYTHPIWIPRRANADPLFRFVKNRKVGYINAKGQIVIPATLPFSNTNDGEEFFEGRLEIDYEDGIGTYIDTKGRKFQLLKDEEEAGYFSEGLGVAKKRGSDLWGFKDKTGKFVISAQFTGLLGIEEFHGGLADIAVNGKTGYIDRTGKFVIPPAFLQASQFNEGIAVVIAEGPCVYVPTGPCSSPAFSPEREKGESANRPMCKFAFIDKTGKFITEQRFDDAGSFSEGLAPVKVGKLWGFIDAFGNLEISPQFESAEPFSDGQALVKAGGLFGYVNHDGAYAIQPRFKNAEGFVDGRAVVENDRGIYAYIDHAGKQAFPGEFAMGSSFFKGLAHVALLPKNGNAGPWRAGWTYAYIDKTGRKVFTYRVDPPRDDE